MGKEFRAPSSKLGQVETLVDEYNRKINKSDDAVMGVSSMARGDSYFAYGWNKIINDLDKIIMTNDSFKNWVHDYIENLRNLEGKLPDSPGFTLTITTTSVSPRHNVNLSEPQKNSYMKENVDGSILMATLDSKKSKKKSKAKSTKSTGSGGSSSGGGTGGGSSSTGSKPTSSDAKTNYQKAIEKAQKKAKEQSKSNSSNSSTSSNAKTNYQQAIENAQKQAKKTQAKTNYQQAIVNAQKQANDPKAKEEREKKAAAQKIKAAAKSGNTSAMQKEIDKYRQNYNSSGLNSIKNSNGTYRLTNK